MTPEDAPFEFRHHTPVQLRFNDIDMLGHLNNNVYNQLYDLAKMRYFEAVQNRRWRDGNVPMAIVNINQNFYAPIYLDENIEVLTAMQYCTARSFHLEQRIVNTDTGEVKSTAVTILAGFDPHTASAKPFEQEILQAIANYEGRPVLRESSKA